MKSFTTADSKTRKLEASSEYKRKLSVENRNIDEPPEIYDLARRNSCEKDLLAFCKIYFPKRFPWNWSRDHYKAAEVLQQCIFGGGKFALAMPRGSGKTAISEVALLWALLYGHRRYCLFIQATAGMAKSALRKTTRRLESNPLLFEDFPEVCYPIRMLEGQWMRSRGQHINGAPTDIIYKSDMLKFPSVKGSVSSAAIIQTFGLTAALRGANEDGAEGEMNRPDFVLIDDAQTRKSALSPSLTDQRDDIISGDILGLAGPGVNMAAVMLCTVIQRNDLSDRFLDRDNRPEWQGHRTKMLTSFPKNLLAWDKYIELRRAALRSGLPADWDTVNKYYSDHHKELHEGAEVSWWDRIRTGDRDALQSAMHSYYENPDIFFAEYQNDPRVQLMGDDVKSYDRKSLVARHVDIPRCEVPPDTVRITSFIDVGGLILWHATVAWNSMFSGVVIDYGTFPQQSRSYFPRSDPRPSLADIYPQYTEEERIFAGVRTLVGDLLAREYKKTTSVEKMRCDLVGIDAGYTAGVISAVISDFSQSNKVIATTGRGRSITTRPVGEWTPRAGELCGDQWKYCYSTKFGIRILQFDTDTWKDFLYNRLTVDMSNRNRLVLPAGSHDLFVDHIRSEYGKLDVEHGITYFKWLKTPENLDNDYLDTLVGNCVLGSFLGLQSQTDPYAGEKQTAPGLSIRQLYEQNRRKV